MTAISAQLVKSLRERTGLGMMECKGALVETNGDIDQAIDLLRKKSSLRAEKKSSRIAAEGVVHVAQEGTNAVIVEVNCETDFVARDDGFQTFAQAVVDAALSSGETDVAVLMAGDLEIKRKDLVQKIGENIQVRRIAKVTGDMCGMYVHTNNKLGALVAVAGGNADLAKDLAMHVTASCPIALNTQDVDQSLIAKEQEIYTEQMRDSGKPDEMISKIVAGKITKFLRGVSLTEQPFIKDPSMTIAALCKQHNATVVSFIRFEVGEGIEKQTSDFASEVQAMTNGG